MWRSGGSKPQSESPGVPPPQSRFFRGPYRLLLVMAVLFVSVVFVFPILFDPGIQLPEASRYGTPFSVAFLIGNRNVTPLTDLEYSCEVSKLTLANGSAVGNANAVIRGSIRRIPGRQAVPGRCETSYIVNAPIQAAEYKLTLRYRAYPWRGYRTAVYHIAAQIDSKGQLTAWKLV